MASISISDDVQIVVKPGEGKLSEKQEGRVNRLVMARGPAYVLTSVAIACRERARVAREYDPAMADKAIEAANKIEALAAELKDRI